MGRTKNGAILATLCLLAGCSSAGPMSPPAESTSPSAEATLPATEAGAGAGETLGAAYETTPCPQPNIAGYAAADFPPEVSCGYLTVPENRARPDGRKIRIFVMRAAAASATPKADPLVYLSGGPGGAGSFEAASMIGKGLNADREVIFVDQRGTHRAEPLLSCPEYDEYVNNAFSQPFTAESVTAGEAATIKACRDRLAATGVDLASYNSTENAADIADLRQALGIDSWNVYGVSYGSDLALHLLRDHPEGIRSVVLDSVSPPNNNIAEQWWSAPASSFAAIFAACAEQPACAAAYPNLATDLTEAVNRLNETPVTVTVNDASGNPKSVILDGYQLAYAAIMASEHADASGIPKMIANAARGDTADLAAAMPGLLTPPQFMGLGGYGLAFGVFCREAANRTTEAAALAKAASVLPGFPESVLRVQPKQGRLFTECPEWDVGTADDAVVAPAVSDLPVLVMEGLFDAATAPEWVDLITPQLPNAQVVEFPDLGHAVLGKTACAQAIMAAFLDDPTKPVDAACAAEKTVNFVTN